MNFFGHAVSACWQSEEPAFVLGAMLPDFASMCRGRFSACGDGHVATGVEFHHRCDAIFHRAPMFRELSRWLEHTLRDRHVRRGAARGAGHVAIELLLDGALIDDAAAVRVYPLALKHARNGDVSLRWREPAQAERWRDLMLRLSDHGLPVGYRDSKIVAHRVTQILARRPLLALTDAESAIVADSLAEASTRVHEHAGAMCAYVRDQLGLAIRQQR